MSETSSLASSAEVYCAIQARHPAPAWAVLSEVRNGTGYARGPRTADALAMSLWPSRGLELHGFEIKVSRSDWLKEKADPAKAEEILQFCDRWWLAVGSEKIIQPGELPPTWGLLVPKRGKLHVAVGAPKLEAKPVTRLFLASLLRSVAEADEAIIETKAHQLFEKKLREQQQKFNDQIEIEKLRFEAIKSRAEKEIQAFEQASGVRIDVWNGGRIGEAVKAVLEQKDVGSQLRKFSALRDEMKYFLQETEAMPEQSDKMEAST